MKCPKKTLQNVTKCAIILKYESHTYNFSVLQKYGTLWSIFLMVMGYFIRHKPRIYLKSEKYSKSLLLSFYYPKYNGMCDIFLGTTSSKNVKAKSVCLWIKKVLLILRIIPKMCHIIKILCTISIFFQRAHHLKPRLEELNTSHMTFNLDL